jgi:hypothetical protein
MIPLADIDLRHEIGLTTRRPGRAGVRRTYAARVTGRKSKVTVTLYQGDGAEEVCCILF